MLPVVAKDHLQQAGKALLMVSEPRLYRDQRDFERLLILLQAGRQAANGTFYIHPGDLSWWLYYQPPGIERRENLYLWEDGDRLLAWSLFSPDYQAFDVFMDPALRGTALAEHMLAWTVTRMGALAAVHSFQHLNTLWIGAQDRATIALLEGLGFTCSTAFMHYLEQPLMDNLPAPLLPDGFVVRGLADVYEADNRAAAQYAAFESRMPIGAYQERYRRFMQSPVYGLERDIVVVAPDGRIAAFCIIWLDALNRIGLFEPVGTHPDFSRRGLGKAVVSEGLGRMKSWGMRKAIVCAESDNSAAYSLYEAVGFHPVDRICTYRKAIRDKGK